MSRGKLSTATLGIQTTLADFEFTAQRGRGYRIETHLGSNPDTVLILYDSRGNRIAEDHDSGIETASRLDWTAPETGRYRIQVSGYAGATGTYALSLTEKSTPAPTAAPQPTPTWVPPADAIVTLAISEDPFRGNFTPFDGLSDAKQQVNSLVFSRLMRRSASGIVPDLAAWWEASHDGRVWTVGLRQDARFHDGRPVSAADVSYSIQAIDEFFDTLPYFEDLAMLDDYTLRIEFREPFWDFPSLKWPRVGR